MLVIFFTPQLQLKALHTIKSLFQRQDSTEVNVHFIHSLGPEVVKLVESYGASLVSAGGERPEAAVVIEASQVLETLLAMTAEANSEF